MTNPFDDAEARRVQAAGRAAHYQRWENGQLQQGQQHYEHWGLQHVAGAGQQPEVRHDALERIDLLIDVVADMRNALQALEAEVRAMRQQPPGVVQFPATALRHGNPR